MKTKKLKKQIRNLILANVKLRRKLQYSREYCNDLIVNETAYALARAARRVLAE